MYLSSYRLSTMHFLMDNGKHKEALKHAEKAEAELLNSTTKVASRGGSEKAMKKDERERYAEDESPLPDGSFRPRTDGADYFQSVASCSGLNGWLRSFLWWDLLALSRH